MTHQRQIELEVEVPVTPEQAWEAVATGPGVTSWFMPAEVEGRPGGAVVHWHDGVTPSTGTVTAYDRPHRFAYQEESQGLGPGEDRPIATEFLVEAREGGTCVVRVVMSGFGDSEAWDRAIESFAKGWRQALGSLRLYLIHFRGEPVSSVSAGVQVSAADDPWPRLIHALGMPADPTPGQWVATTGPGAPTLAGTLAQAGDRMLTLRLEQPAPGIGLVGVGGPGGDQIYVVVRAQLFGPDTDGIAAHEQQAWDTWLAAMSGA